jgi:hypothetical protein
MFIPSFCKSQKCNFNENNGLSLRPIGCYWSASIYFTLVLDAILQLQLPQACRTIAYSLHHTPQNDQLMSKRRVLGFKPALRLEWRGQDGQYET